MRLTDHLDKQRVRRHGEAGFLLQFTNQVEDVAIILKNLAPVVVAHEDARPVGKRRINRPSCPPGGFPGGTPDVFRRQNELRRGIFIAAFFRGSKTLLFKG